MTESVPDDELYHLSQPILTHMGLVIAYWGAYEAQIEFFILRNQEIPSRRGMILTANLSYRAKSDLLLMFANNDDHLSDTAKTELKALVNDANRLYGRRNMVAHCAWLPTDDPMVARVMGIRTRGKLIETNDLVPVDVLKGYATEIRQLGQKMGQFMERNGIHPEDGY